MNRLLIFLALSFFDNMIMGQGNFQRYDIHIKKADSLYQQKNYRAAALSYSEAFKSIGWKGAQRDRYNAACSWALAGNADSAFFQLDNIVTKGLFSDYAKITSDRDLQSLAKDKRWQPLLNLVKQNKEKVEANYNRDLVAQLDTIYASDQKYRQQMDSVQKTYGPDSKQMDSLWEIVVKEDSLNVNKVVEILDRHGWPGPDVVGDRGAHTLFLVIQHASLPTQEKYLPMMREAVKSKKLQSSYLALLEDRVAIGRGKKQIYGTQIGFDKTSGKNFIFPLEDPDNVDTRRAKVGLQPLAEYVGKWNIDWNPAEYKKSLPSLEAKLNAGRK